MRYCASVTLVCPTVPQISVKHCVSSNQIDPGYIKSHTHFVALCQHFKFHRHFVALCVPSVNISPSRARLFLSAAPEFLERGEFPNNLSRRWTLKKSYQHIFHEITTPPRASHIAHIAKNTYMYIISLISLKAYTCISTR